MIRLIVLCLAIASALAVSNPDIATKSGKSQTSATTQKVVSQQDESLLNSINAYAQQYETNVFPSKSYGLTTQLYAQQPYASQPQVPYASQPQYTPQANYKYASSPQIPSSPTLETNFQPMPSAAQHHHQPHIQASQQSPATPVLMQYVPQSPINEGGVQYIQLIPTRPLIVPISPYMSPMAQQQYQAQQIIAQPQVSDYSGRSLAPANEQGVPNNIPYGLQSYANSLQNYRSYRFNREAKPNNAPQLLLLNMNEYMPSPNDAPKPHSHVIRGRP